MFLTIAALGVYVVVQNQNLHEQKTLAQNLNAELGSIENKSSDKIVVRALADRDGSNTWRFRIHKPKGKQFQYYFGVVQIDESGEPVLPKKYRSGF